jgi:serine/threonine protein kinase
VMDQLDPRSKMRITHDVAKAMSYLHSFVPPVLHRDLKPSNVLISRDGRVKLADFGVSRLMADESKTAQARMTKDAGELFCCCYFCWFPVY